MQNFKLPSSVKTLRNLLACWTLALPSCATTSTTDTTKINQLPPPPPITKSTSLDDLVSLAMEYGGEPLQKVKKQVRDRNLAKEVENQLIPILKNSAETLADHQLLNAANLYAYLPTPVSPELFLSLVQSERLISRRVGWQLAAQKLHPKLAMSMDRALSQALIEDNLSMVLLPQMANAVRINRLKSAYTVVRQGLLLQGDEEYALAMIALNPTRASEDFIPYLVLAPAEELRQLTVSSVKIYTVMTVLRHLKNYPPNVGTQGFDHLFAYMVSRNNGISDLARSVIEAYLPAQANTLAIGLAKQPPWLQVAFLENVRRQTSPGLAMLLQELRQTTSETNVARDIDEIRD